MSENLIIASSVFFRTSARSTCRHSWSTDTTFSVQIASLNYLLQGKMGHWESWYVVQSIPLFFKKFSSRKSSSYPSKFRSVVSFSVKNSQISSQRIFFSHIYSQMQLCFSTFNVALTLFVFRLPYIKGKDSVLFIFTAWPGGTAPARWL